MRVSAPALLIAMGLPAAVQSDALGNAEAGRDHFRQCMACHQVGQGAENRIGPHLNMLFGRTAGSLGDFSYSQSLERAGANGLEWHADTLDAYLENPKAFASGTRMNFAGIADPQERADVIAYLRGFSADPSNLPEADPTARATDHDLDPEILAIRGDPEYGEYLSGECTSCHGTDGSDDGIPSITGWPEEDFVVAMHAYKAKARPNPVMQMMAGRLGNEEIAALAAYFMALND